MNKEIQNTLSDCVKTKTSDILQEERAQHSERLEKVQDLLNKNMDLWEKKDALQSEERDFRSEITKLKKDVNKITKESLIHEKVRERLLTISAEKWYNCDLGGIRIWTGDLLICSQMLYHWAIPPHGKLCITVSLDRTWPVVFMQSFSFTFRFLRSHVLLQRIYVSSGLSLVHTSFYHAAGEQT